MRARRAIEGSEERGARSGTTRSPYLHLVRDRHASSERSRRFGGPAVARWVRHHNRADAALPQACLSWAGDFDDFEVARVEASEIIVEALPLHLERRAPSQSAREDVRLTS